MKKIFTLLALACSLAVLSQPISITSAGSPYNQNFDGLSNTQGSTSSTVPAGWSFFETGTNANTTYGVDDGTNLSGNTYSYGASGSSDRAFGGLQSGSLAPVIGAMFTNNTGVAITTLTITYTGEMWRAGVASRGSEDRFDFQYSLDATALNSGSWTDVNELDLGSPNTNTTAGAKNGNAVDFRRSISFTISGLNIAPGSSFMIRWLDFNITSSDDGLAVDDFSLTANGGSLAPCATPAAQPTALQFSGNTSSSISGSFTAASPAADQYLVVASTSASLGANPADGTEYVNGDAIGNGVVVYRGSATTFTANNLSASTTYYFFVFSLNAANCSGGPAYLSATPLSASSATTAPPACVAPTAAVTGLQLFSGSTSINGNFTETASANGYLVCISTQAALSFVPVNGASYTVGQTVGNGQVIKFGPGNTFSATGLQSSQTYYLFVFSLSQFGCTGGPLYFATPATGSIATTSGGSGIPDGYYTNAAGKSCAELKTALKTIITNGMAPKSYSSLFNQYLVSDIKPREVGSGSANVIWDIYSDVPGPANDPYNFTPGTSQCGNYSVEGDCYNREHSVPQSWFGANASSGSIGPESDFHHIFPTDGKVNGYRGSYIYGEVASASITSLNGSKLGSSALAGFSGLVFEPIDAYKGDVARAFLYFVTRYEDNMPSWNGGANGTQAFDPSKFPSVDVPYLQLMLRWHNEDPVSQKEIDRNNSAYAYQGNRNPFVDNPDYANLVWNSTCPGLGALPATLFSFGGRLQGSRVALAWDVAQEQHVRAYVVQRSSNGRDFTTIGEVKASGKKQYGYDDDIASITGRRLYYRLAITDVDGKVKYSDVFSLHVPLHHLFTAYPNPARDAVQLQFSSSLGKGTLRLTDQSGRVLLSQKLQGGVQSLSLPVSKLANGIYLMVVQGEDGTQASQRIQVLH